MSSICKYKKGGLDEPNHMTNMSKPLLQIPWTGTP